MSQRRIIRSFGKLVLSAPWKVISIPKSLWSPDCRCRLPPICLADTQVALATSTLVVWQALSSYSLPYLLCIGTWARHWLNNEQYMGLSYWERLMWEDQETKYEKRMKEEVKFHNFPQGIMWPIGEAPAGLLLHPVHFLKTRHLRMVGGQGQRMQR